MRVPDMTPGWYWDEDEPDAAFVAPVPTVHVTENPVVATLYGPNGNVIRQAHARRQQPFGFARNKDTA